MHYFQIRIKNVPVSFKLIQPRKASRGIYVRIPSDLRNGGQTTRWFGNHATDAHAYCAALNKARATCGKDFFELPVLVQASILNWIKEIGSERVIRALEYYKKIMPKFEKTVRQVCDECYASKKQIGVREKTLTNFKYECKNFSAHLGDKLINLVTIDECKSFVYDNDRAPATRASSMRAGVNLMRYAMAHGYANSNPFDAVDYPRIPQKTHRIFTVDEVRRLLDACKEHDPALLGLWCPDLFGGLRPAEASRLTPEAVAHGQIELDGEHTKKKRRRVVVMNETLKAWLSVPGVEYGNLKNLKRRKDKILEIAQIAWSPDVCRHTFCSYAVAKWGKALTAQLACTSEYLLDATYVSRVKDQAEVEAFWTLKP